MFISFCSQKNIAIACKKNWYNAPVLCDCKLSSAWNLNHPFTDGFLSIGCEPKSLDGREMVVGPFPSI